MESQVNSPNLMFPLTSEGHMSRSLTRTRFPTRQRSYSLGRLPVVLAAAVL